MMPSTLYKHTVKTITTPGGRKILAIKASALRTSETGSIGWPTPAARDWISASGSPEFLANRLEQTRGKPLSETVFAQLSGWPTCTATDAARGVKDARPQDTGKPLTQIAALAGWPTPNATVVDHRPRPPIMSNRKPTDPQISLADQAFHLAGWMTPKASDPDFSTPRTSGRPMHKSRRARRTNGCRAAA